MNLRQFLLRKLMLFFTLSTLITVAIYILGASLDPAARFGYTGFLSPLIYAGACVIPSLVTWSKRELKPRELLPRSFSDTLGTVYTACMLMLAMRGLPLKTILSAYSRPKPPRK